MRAKQLVTIAAGAMLLRDGVAAVGAASPIDQTSDFLTGDEQVGNASDTASERSGTPMQTRGRDLNTLLRTNIST